MRKVRPDRRNHPGRPGRPSLADEGGTSPTIEFRLPSSLRERVEQVAQREHRTVSAVARAALENYVDAAAPPADGTETPESLDRRRGPRDRRRRMRDRRRG